MHRLGVVGAHIVVLRAAPAAPPPPPAPERQLVAGRRLRASDIIFGGIHIGPSDSNQSMGAWGRTATQEAATLVVRAALETGIRDFDTAPMYGNGAAEERLGASIAGVGPTLAESARITTKTGRLVRSADLEPEERTLVADYSGHGARLSHQESLHRMGLQRIFSLRVHDCDGAGAPPTADNSDAVLAPDDGHLAALRELRAAGHVEEISLGMNSHVGFGRGPRYILRLLQEAPKGTFDTALLAGGWNLLCHEGWEVLAECARQGIRVHVAGVFGGTGQSDNRNIFAPDVRWQPVADAWAQLGKQYDVTLAQLAIAFATLPRAVSQVVLGMATADEVKSNVRAIEHVRQVPMAVWHAAAARGLLPTDLLTGLVEEGSLG